MAGEEGKRCGGLVGDGGDGVSGWNGVAGVLRGEKGLVVVVVLRAPTLRIVVVMGRWW